MVTKDAEQNQSAEQPSSDAVLIAAARRGDKAAFEMLLSRHADAALRLARRLSPTAANELVAEAIDSVDAELRSGAGPKAAFRAHLLTAVRRVNLDRAKAIGKVRPIDELVSSKTLMVADCQVRPEFIAPAARAFRDLPESQQVALWHTEVDSEPFLDTGLLLGVAGTDVAELAFGARDSLRRAMIGSQLDNAASGPCRWTADRLGAHVRKRLTPTIAEKVRAHLASCEACRELVPAVTAIETEMQALVAMVVLGAAAGPYLGQETVPAARARKAPVAILPAQGGDAAAGLIAGHRKAAMFAGAAAALAAIGLVGGLQMAGHSETTNTQAESSDGAQQLTVVPKVALPAVQTQTPDLAPAQPEDMLGLSEHTHDPDAPDVTVTTPAKADTSKKVHTTAVHPVVIHKHSHAPAPATTDSNADKPATNDKPTTPKDDAKKIHLGVADVSVGDGGLLGVLKVEKPEKKSDSGDKPGPTGNGATGSGGVLGLLTNPLTPGN
ncbi:MAG TPA: zf-HC2 domain-containing protein [Sporichthyaceae bacterium]|jgi:DNA-directed RNA polymerase specialized sigma24 family protein